MPFAPGSTATALATRPAAPAQGEAIAFLALAVVLVGTLLIVIALGALALIVSRRRRLVRERPPPPPGEPPVDAWAEAGRRVPLEEGPATEPGSD